MISLKERFPDNDAIWIFSNPKIAQKKAFEFYGPNAILHRSNTKNKKYCIQTPEGKKINFGQMGFFFILHELMMNLKDITTYKGHPRLEAIGNRTNIARIIYHVPFCGNFH